MCFAIGSCAGIVKEGTRLSIFVFTCVDTFVTSMCDLLGAITLQDSICGAQLVSCICNLGCPAQTADKQSSISASVGHQLAG